MSSPSTHGRRNDRPPLRAELDGRALLSALLAVLVSAPVTFVVVRAVGWNTLRRDLHTWFPEHTALAVETPLSVLLFQAELAVVVGLLVGLETVAYQVRDALPVVGSVPGSRPVGRRVSVVLCVAALPVGAVLGYGTLVPVLVSGGAASVVDLMRVATYVPLGTGIATQLAVVVVTAARRQ